MPEFDRTHNEIRAQKRRRLISEKDESGSYYITRYVRRPAAGPHVPNKNEAQVLRRLMSKTGLSEPELRERKTYRVMLSEAQQARGTKTRAHRLAFRVLRHVTQELVLPKEHPLVKTAFKVEWDSQIASWRRLDVVRLDAGEAWKLLGVKP